jgi:hypothetical protein
VFNQQLFWADKFFEWIEKPYLEQLPEVVPVPSPVLTVAEQIASLSLRITDLEEGFEDLMALLKE